jgi:hypothetical protein
LIKISTFIVVGLVIVGPISADEAAGDSIPVDNFATPALECIHQEYPSKIAHVLQSDEDVAPPRELTPAFCGCFDWHSSVHGHWLLVRLSKLYPDAEFATAASTRSSKMCSWVRLSLRASPWDCGDWRPRWRVRFD